MNIDILNSESLETRQSTSNSLYIVIFIYVCFYICMYSMYRHIKIKIRKSDFLSISSNGHDYYRQYVGSQNR